MRQDLEVLRSQLEHLQQVASQLSQQLAEAAVQLETEGSLPDLQLAVRLEDYQREFRQLRTSLVRRAGAGGAETSEASPQPERLTELADLLAGRIMRHQALSLLDTLLLVEHEDGEPFEPLEQCQTAARQLMEEIRGAREVRTIEAAVQLNEGTHPFSSLVQLVTDTGQLNDDDWTRCPEMVQEHFGRAMAVAAARGRLHPPGGGDSGESSSRQQADEEQLERQMPV
ncbi:MAG: hypothetical protein KDA79_01075 [Planctomycetaceae bacterium]|nr:hypothetical protein [Planctomycetaceae bacterium]